jgi:hypothetical protein
MPQKSRVVPEEQGWQKCRRERRATVRYPCDRTGSCAVFPSYETFRARVQDISARGIGMIMAREFKPDTLLIVELAKRDGSSRLGVASRVTHSLKLGAFWSIGCEFDTPLNEEVLQALV